MGRTSFSGPVRGGYLVWTVCADDLGINEDTSYRYVAPCSLRVMETSISADLHTLNAAYRLRNTGTGGAGTNDIIAARAVPASDAIEVLTPTSSPALAFRNIAKGERIELLLDMDGTAVLEGLIFVMTAFATGHVVALDTND